MRDKHPDDSSEWQPHYEGFYSENLSKTGFEPWFTRHIYEPIVQRIPSWVSPNMISAANHFVVWMLVVLSAVAPYVSRGEAMVLRLLAAVAVLTSQMLDCLDGMHARNTGQSSRLGEVMDHWLDALNVPLFAAAMLLTLNVGPWVTAIAMVTATMPYNMQLVLYYRTGHFVYPTTSGFDAQILLFVSYIVFAVLFYFYPENAHWAVVGKSIYVWVGVGFNIAVFFFYYPRIRSFFSPHLRYIASGAIFVVLYWMGAMPTVLFLLSIAVISFRLNGRYVVSTVLARRFDGGDVWIPMWGLAIAVGHVLLAPYDIRGYSLGALFPMLFVLHMAAVNLMGLLRQLPEIRSADEASPHNGQV